VASFVVRKPITVMLLIAVTVIIVAVTIGASGKSYTKVSAHPFEDIRGLKERTETRPVSTNIFAVIVMPIIGNIALFIPWAMLMFITLYTKDRPTAQTYLLTILLGISFTTGIEAWQYFLPSRVVDINDVIWNSVGTVIGAMLGHMRLRLRLEFA
jgi:glycopeptide antibiotics resistance protein